nr:MAG TPA: Alpha-2,3-sialyltransferase [Caudoviricetes sp.]
MDLWTRFNTNQNFIEQPLFAQEFGKPTPPAKKRDGVCIVLGTHPDWYEEIDAALRRYPDADICGVNEAARLLSCDHLATCHGERIDQFIELHRQYHPRKPMPLIHLRDNMQAPKSLDVQHHLWPVRTMAGSAPFAAAAMVMLGYELVIFCGCPMTGGGGYAFDDTHGSTRDDPRIGFEGPQHGMIKSWHRYMRKFKDEQPEMAAKIRSMSGATKEIFGGL